MTDAAEVEPTRLILIRHGESNATVERRLAGFRTCSGLSPLGIEQSVRLRDRLAETGEVTADLLIASTFPRAIETAEVIAPALGLEVVIDERFGEHDPGPDLDGITFKGYIDQFGMPDWHGDPHLAVFPGGETMAEFHHRVGAAISQTVADNPGKTMVVTCHGGVIDAAIRQLLKLSSRGSFELQTLNTSLTEFVRSTPERWRFVRYNDAAHLAGLPSSSRSG